MGRITTLRQLFEQGPLSLSVGAKETRLATINIDVQRHWGLEAICTVTHLPFKSGCLSSVLFADVIEHLPRGEEQKALVEIHRTLSRGGRLLISTPNKKDLFVLLDPSHWLTRHRHYSTQEIVGHLERAGFRLDTIFTSGGVFAMLGVIWYSLVTWPSKKLLSVSTAYSPGFLRKREDAEYLLSAVKGGYTIFAVAAKR